MIERIWQDVRYAGRTFVRSPGFVCIAIATIAIGVGANAAIFSVVNATLLRPLPYPRAHELVLVSGSNRQTGQSTGNATPANFLDWRARHHSFTGMAAFREASVTLSSGDHPERRRAAMVNASFFDVLQIAPAIGRTFTAEDEVHGAQRTAVISDALWRERFGGRPDAVGQRVRFDDETYTIVGVMPPGIDYPGKAQVWVPPHWPVPDDPLLSPAQDPSAQRNHGYFFVAARLKPGVTLKGAAADMDAVAASIERDYPNTNRNVGALLVGLREDLLEGDIRTTTLLLFAAVGLLLLIAAANVSGLLMARASARHQEIALRAALGATRGRILGQLLTESLLLAAIGGASGVLLATWLVPALVVAEPRRPHGRGRCDHRSDGPALRPWALDDHRPVVWPGTGPADEPLRRQRGFETECARRDQREAAASPRHPRRRRNRVVARPSGSRRADGPQLHPGAACDQRVQPGGGADGRYRACVYALHAGATGGILGAGRPGRGSGARRTARSGDQPPAAVARQQHAWPRDQGCATRACKPAQTTERPRRTTSA